MFYARQLRGVSHRNLAMVSLGLGCLLKFRGQGLEKMVHILGFMVQETLAVFMGKRLWEFPEMAGPQYRPQTTIILILGTLTVPSAIWS